MHILTYIYCSKECMYILTYSPLEKNIGGVAMVGDKCQEVSVLCTQIRHCRYLRDCLGVSDKFVFELKKSPNGIRHLKTVRSEAQNQRNRMSPPKNVSLPPLQGLLRRLMGHYRCVPGAALPAYAALELCYLSWLKLGFPAKCALAHATISLTKKLPCWQIAVLLSHSPPLILRDYNTLGALQAKGCYSSLKHGFIEVNHLATEGCQNMAMLWEIAACAGWAWRRSSTLVVATVISSQATVLVHHLKPFSWLRIMK